MGEIKQISLDELAGKLYAVKIGDLNTILEARRNMRSFDNIHSYGVMVNKFNLGAVYSCLRTGRRWEGTEQGRDEDKWEIGYQHLLWANKEPLSEELEFPTLGNWAECTIFLRIPISESEKVDPTLRGILKRTTTYMSGKMGILYIGIMNEDFELKEDHVRRN